MTLTTNASRGTLRFGGWFLVGNFVIAHLRGPKGHFFSLETYNFVPAVHVELSVKEETLAGFVRATNRAMDVLREWRRLLLKPGPVYGCLFR